MGDGTPHAHIAEGSLIGPHVDRMAHRRQEILILQVRMGLLERLHVGLAHDYRIALRAGGRLITAGYTLDQLADVEASLAEAGLRPIDRVSEGEYVGLVHRAAA